MRSEPDAPAACTLATDALGQRLARIRRVTDRSLVSHCLDGATLRLMYRKNALQELEQIVAQERECCAFLRYALEPSGELVQLSIRAPGVEPDAHWLFNQFLPQEQSAATRRGCGCAPGACG